MPANVIETLLAAAKDVPLVAALIFILVGGSKRWWVWGYQLTDAQKALADMKAERDEWKAVAFSGSRSTSHAVETSSKIADVLKATTP